MTFRKEIRLNISGPMEDASGRAETDPVQLGRRMQGLRGESRLRESDQGAGTQVCSNAPQDRALTLECWGTIGCN